MKSTHYRHTRRTFLCRSTLYWSVIVLGPLGCAARSSCPAFEIDAKVPARLLFPADAKNTSAARLDSLTCVDEVVLLSFSDGRTLRWDKGLSFDSRSALQGGMADRAAVAPKVVAAYALERLGQILRHARTGKILRLHSEVGIDDEEYRAELTALVSLQHDFDVFQEQPVLDAVSIGAVYDFALALRGVMDRVSHVVWNAENRQFDLDSA